MSSTISPPDRAVLTVEEYADSLAISVSTVRRRIDRGEIPVLRPTAQVVRIPRAFLDEEIAEAMQTHTNEQGDDLPGLTSS